MTKTYRIAAIPGDGIGKEVLPVGQRVIDLVAEKFGFTVEWTEFDWSCERYHQTGRMMPEDGIEQIKAFDSIFLGAVGFPGVPDHVSLWGLLIPLRRELDQYANVRPVRLLKGITSPLAGRGPEDIDMIVVRENVEGEYSEIGGRVYQGTEHEAAIQESILTRRGTDRIMDYAFDLAAKRKRGHVSSATKSNGIIHTMPFWDERFAAAAERHPDIATAQFHIDIMTAHFVLHPDWFDVVVASNLFGDILSDLGPAVAGSIGIAPSANINPEGKFPSMFEPVHGSAPDIAGKGVANPVAAVWTAAMMLEHLGEAEAAAEIERAIEVSLASPETKTRDLGGTADTAGSEAAILAAL
ncbi:MAG: tartrate dehydrogenase [Sediminimonas qiaohouensis]|uniref:D-malate dehydrogenase [decarboxylating] n=1 Tax=Sediminimonas qiaohouensis TaxID=552061 RepID=A0A7C9HLP1_9RHOB|nr:tartrate dehydrogenase [Sediminimonas qiaohouensis]MTJ04548.1 tartrate dehydrogenase [Sediminimonas qiaohouensis]